MDFDAHDYNKWNMGKPVNKKKDIKDDFCDILRAFESIATYLVYL